MVGSRIAEPDSRCPDVRATGQGRSPSFQAWAQPSANKSLTLQIQDPEHSHIRAPATDRIRPTHFAHLPENQLTEGPEEEIPPWLFLAEEIRSSLLTTSILLIYPFYQERGEITFWGVPMAAAFHPFQLCFFLSCH